MPHGAKARSLTLVLVLAVLASALGLLGCLNGSSSKGSRDAGAPENDAAFAVFDASGVVEGGSTGPATIDAAVDAGAAGPYAIGGRVVGLVGTGLVLQNAGSDPLSVPSDGPFVFATLAAVGAPYAVTVAAQPHAPAQTCSVSLGSGAVVGPVMDIVVSCSTEAYPVGGIVTGLALDGGTSHAVLLTNGLPDGGDDRLSVSQNGSFAFPTEVPSGAGYAIAIGAQPTSPAQTCVVSGGTGTVLAGAVTSAVVNCAANSYVVGGTVTGLTGFGLVLANGANTVSVSANGTFAFSQPIASGSSYAVTVATQPTSPSQICTVTKGSGVVASANVATVQVACGASSFAIGGTVSGLAGTGLVLQTAAGDSVAVTANGSFAFATAVASGASYAVSVKTQPTNPWQTCSVASGSGTVGNGAVSNVAVTCATNLYTLGGTVSGLTGSGLTLTVNGGATLSVAASGAFVFASPLASGTAYAVAVQKQPTGPAQTCTVGSGSGTIHDANVATVSVTCAVTAFTVGGTISGLTGSGLTLTDNGGSALSIAAGATSFTFTQPVASGGTYAVAVSAQPTGPAQSCTVSGATGTVVAGPVTTVFVNCGTSSFSVGGTVAGLAGQGLVLANGSAAVAVSANGSFTFGSAVPSGTTYAVTVKTQPSNPTQVCSVAQGTGSVGSANVTSVAVTCTTSAFAISGAVANLAGSGLVLEDNGGNPLSITASGPFAFTSPVASGASYAVTVKTQPAAPSQTCSVTNGAGTVGGGPVGNVQVSCVTSTYTVSAAVSGLAGAGLTLSLDGASSLSVGGNGTFVFAKSLPSGTSYSVAVTAQPQGPTQTCTVASPTGTIGSANVTVAVSCATSAYTIGGTVSGLTGSGLVLTDNGGDAITLAAGASSFTFPARVASGASYDVQIATQPTSPTQSCTVSGATGTVGGANVTSASINCGTSAFVVGGTIAGLAGSGLVLQNGSDRVSISANGSFAFPTPVASGASYGVTVQAQPTSPSQTCTVVSGSGTVTTGAVGDVQVTCATESFSVSVQVSGDVGQGLVLLDNGVDALSVNGDGTYTFASPVPSGAGYSIGVSSDPIYPWETCSVTNGSGSVGAGPVSGIQVYCYTSYFYVGGAVTGLTGSGLVLAMNGQSLSVAGAGPFQFPSPLASDSSYAVSISSQPSGPAQTCTVTANGSGTVYGSGVGSVSIDCQTSAYAISGTVTGLVGNDLIVTDNGGDSIGIAAGATSFTFPTAIASGSAYDVEVGMQPANPNQVCQVTGGTGTVGSGPVGSVAINCSTSSFTVSGTVTGLAGSRLELTDGAGDIIAVTGSSFSTPPLASNTPFSIIVYTQPVAPWQTCTVSNGNGIITSSNIGGVIVSCTTNQYSLSLSSSGILPGSSLTVSDGYSSVSVSGNGTTTFPGTIASGATFAVSITQGSPYQSCSITSNASGTMASGNLTADLSCGNATYPLTLDVANSATYPCTSTLYAMNGSNDVPFTLTALGNDVTFPNWIPYGGSYAASLSTSCYCSVTGGSLSGTAYGPIPLVYMSCSSQTQ